MATIKDNQTKTKLDMHKNQSRRYVKDPQEFRPKRIQKTKRTKCLTRSEIERFRTELRAKHNEVLRTLSGIQDGISGADTGDMGPMDSADMALISHMAEENNGLLGSEAHVLEEINEALERIQEGTYGLCQKCMRPIARRRLQAIPWARYCVPCANGTQSSKPESKKNEKQKWAQEQAYRLQRLFERWLKAHGIDSREFYGFEVKELLDYYDDPLRRSLIESLS